MAILVLGLVIFFAPHVFTMQRGARAQLLARLGEGTYKGLYSLVSLVGLVLIVWGYARYRAAGYVPIWDPPRFMRDIAFVLMIPAVILLVAAYVPGEIKRRVKHPMLAAVKVWALAHLLANGDLGSILLFGTFLAYAVFDRIAVKRRPEPARGAPTPPGWSRNDTIAVAAGGAAFVAIVFVLHGPIIGVSALPR